MTAAERLLSELERRRWSRSARVGRAEVRAWRLDGWGVGANVAIERGSVWASADLVKISVSVEILPKGALR